MSFCRSTYLCIADSWFPRKPIHHWIWYSNDFFTKKAIDHIIISCRWLWSVTQCPALRGAQHGNIYQGLLCANIRLKLRAPPGSRQHHQPDISPWRTPKPGSSTSVKSPNAMRPSLYQQTSGSTSKNTTTACETKCFRRNAPAPRSHGSPGDTWNHWEPAVCPTSRRPHEILPPQLCTKCLQNDRGAFWQEKATTLEEAAVRKNEGTLFRVLRSLRSGNRNCSTPIRDKAGRTLISEPEYITRWQEIFFWNTESTTDTAYRRVDRPS